MAKRKTPVKTLDQLDASIKRWHTRIKIALGKIQLLERQKRRIRSKAAAEGVELPAKPQPKAKAPPKEPEVDPTTQLGVLGPAPGFDAKGNRVPDDLEIPAFLKRDAQVRQELADRKKTKEAGAAARSKALRKERAAYRSIPKSKRRWDTNTSQWVEDQA